MSQRRVLRRMAVGVDQHGVDLSRQTVDHVRNQRLAAEHHKTFVASPKAAALAAGEHESGNAFAHASGKLPGLTARRVHVPENEGFGGEIELMAQRLDGHGVADGLLE